MSIGLPPGNWRYDPRRRCQVWVPLDPEVEIPDAFEEQLDPLINKRTGKPYSNFCTDCAAPILDSSLRCTDCSREYRKNDPEEFKRRPNGTTPVDERVVQKVLDGKRLRCTRSERFEVIRRWTELGRSDYALVNLTGWNVPRDRKYLNTLNEQDAA